jgi:hypothetical protein
MHTTIMQDREFCATLSLSRPFVEPMMDVQRAQIWERARPRTPPGPFLYSTPSCFPCCGCSSRAMRALAACAGRKFNELDLEKSLRKHVCEVKAWPDMPFKRLTALVEHLRGGEKKGCFQPNKILVAPESL